MRELWLTQTPPAFPVSHSFLTDHLQPRRLAGFSQDPKKASSQRALPKSQTALTDFSQASHRNDYFTPLQSFQGPPGHKHKAP